MSDDTCGARTPTLIDPPDGWHADCPCVCTEPHTLHQCAHRTAWQIASPEDGQRLREAFGLSRRFKLEGDVT